MTTIGTPCPVEFKLPVPLPAPDGNTNVTVTGAQVSARASRRRRRRAGVRGWFCGAAARSEDPDLAPLSGGARRPRHLLRPALPARARDARRARKQIVTHTARASTARRLAEIRRYTKLFWINSGPYNNLTARKFVLTCTREAFAQGGARRRRGRGAFPSARRDARRAARAARADVLRSERRPDRHEQDAAAGQDILTASANNLYDGVTMADLEGFKERIGSTRAW